MIMWTLKRTHELSGSPVRDPSAPITFGIRMPKVASIITRGASGSLVRCPPALRCRCKVLVATEAEGHPLSLGRHCPSNTARCKPFRKPDASPAPADKWDGNSSYQIDESKGKEVVEAKKAKNTVVAGV